MRPLFKRLGRRLRGQTPGAKLGPVWTEAEPYAKEAFQNISASFVASWEIAAAALYRVGTQRWEKQEVADLVNRFSDGLVPTTESLSAVEHQIAGSWRLAANDGDTLTARLPRLRELISPLGPNTAVGWGKTVDYIRPILEQLELAPEHIATIDGIGAAIEGGLTDQVEQLIDRLAKLPGENLQRELLSALQAFSDGGSRLVEIELDAVRRLIQGDT